MTTTTKTTDNDLQAEIKRLMAENEALKNKKVRALSLKVSEKGAISLYGLRAQFPATYYLNEWERILDFATEIRQFMVDNKDKLATKE